jgi:cytoskeletal protein CcmA (bactofilin family)
MNQIDGHFDEMTGLLYLEGQLDRAHFGIVSAHLDTCAECRELLGALEREGAWLREALTVDDESIPARVIAAPEDRSTHWGWWIALGLVAGGAYTLWTGFIEPWMTQASNAGFTQGNVLTMIFFTGAFWKGWDTMRTLTEFMAVATLGMLAIWLLRRHWQRLTAVAFVMGALAGGLALPQPVAAADMEHGDPAYTLPAGQEVKTDLIVVANRTQIDGDVDGDLIVWSQYLTVNGHVKGDILGFGQEIRVNGPVDGNVRLMCQAATLNSTVAKNAMAWAQAIELDSKAKVGGTMTIGTEVAQLNGQVGGDVLAAAELVDINGSLGHNLQVRSERLNIGPSAEIAGSASYLGRREPEISPGAKLATPIQVTYEKRGPNYSQGTYYWHQILFWGAGFLLGLVMLLVMPGFFFDVSQACKKIGPAIGFGALFLFATPIAAVIVCATIVGLSVGLPTLALYAMAIYATKIFVGAWLGEKLLGASVGFGPAVGRLALGLVILRALRMLPYVGLLIGLLTVMMGLGAIVLALHRRVSPQVAAVALAG